MEKSNRIGELKARIAELSMDKNVDNATEIAELKGKIAAEREAREFDKSYVARKAAPTTAS